MLKKNIKNQNNSDTDLETARKQASEYAMALDLLAKISLSGSENEVVERILELFTILFSPQKLSYLSLEEGQPGHVYSLSSITEDDDSLKKRLANFTEKYSWTKSGKGFLLTIKHEGIPLGILEVDKISFPKYKEHYLNLALSIVDVCGLTIENARKYQQIQNSKHKLRLEKEKAEEALAKVKKLSGLLPICSICKKIRDDKGYWNQLEEYIQEHSEAEFSHGLCKACIKEHYSDLKIYDD